VSFLGAHFEMLSRDLRSLAERSNEDQDHRNNADKLAHAGLFWRCPRTDALGQPNSFAQTGEAGCEITAQDEKALGWRSWLLATAVDRELRLAYTILVLPLLISRGAC
jgi:hypothetical protein